MEINSGQSEDSRQDNFMEQLDNKLFNRKKNN